MLQVSKETDILRANICRYIAKWKEAGQIQVICKGRCPHTHFTAGFYSTDKALFRATDDRQLTLNLFDNANNA
jgi:hypothetical protein